MSLIKNQIEIDDYYFEKQRKNIFIYLKSANIFFRNPRLFLSILFRSYQLLTEEHNIYLKIRTFPNSKNIWVSRSSINFGFYPTDLNRKLEYDFSRSIKKIKIFVWPSIYNMNLLNFRLYLKDKILKFNEIQSKREKYTILKDNAKIYSGKVLTFDNSIVESIDISDQKNLYPYFINFTGIGYQVFKENYSSHYSYKNCTFLGSNSNYFHFLVEVLPNIYKLDENLIKKMRIVLEDKLPSQIYELCEIVTGNKPIKIELQEVASFSCLYVPSDLNYFDIELLKKLRNTLLGEIETKLGNIERLYIKRTNNLFRRLINHSKLEKDLTKLGFKAIDPVELPISDQIYFFSKAKIIIIESGAAMTNLIFADPGCLVIEIQPPDGDLLFWENILVNFGIQIIPLLGKSSFFDKIFFGKDSFKINLRDLRKILDFNLLRIEKLS